jgi:hypothetical protein
MDKEGTSALRDLPSRALAGGGTQKCLEELGGRLRGHSDETIVPSYLSAESQTALHPVWRLLIYLSTALRLGVANVARVVIYSICSPDAAPQSSAACTSQSREQS